MTVVASPRRGRLALAKTVLDKIEADDGEAPLAAHASDLIVRDIDMPGRDERECVAGRAAAVTPRRCAP